MINTVKYKFMLRPDILAKDGCKYIYLYANVNGSKTLVSVGSLIPVKSWNQAEQNVKSGFADQRTINNKLAQIKIQINNLINRGDSIGNVLTTSEIKNIIKGGGNADSFYLFMEKETNRLNLSSGTIKIYKGRLVDLKKFKNELKFSDVSTALWYEYETYLMNKGNSQNTISNAYIQVNVFINKAVELDLLTVNPWAKIKVKTIKGNRQFLSLDELKKVELFFKQNEEKKYQSVVRPFLFSCYTGIRFSDVKKLTGKDISGKWINTKVKKTGKIERIPMRSRAIDLLPEKIGNGKLFTFAAHDLMGKYLTEIMTKLTINKKITFHCSRHTFATLNLEKSGNLALVSKLLGHADIKTTQIYAKILDSSKSKLMDEWDESDKVALHTYDDGKKELNIKKECEAELIGNE